MGEYQKFESTLEQIKKIEERFLKDLERIGKAKDVNKITLEDARIQFQILKAYLEQAAVDKWHDSITIAQIGEEHRIMSEKLYGSKSPD